MNRREFFKGMFGLSLLSLATLLPSTTKAQGAVKDYLELKACSRTVVLSDLRDCVIDLDGPIELRGSVTNCHIRSTKSIAFNGHARLDSTSSFTMNTLQI